MHCRVRVEDVWHPVTWSHLPRHDVDLYCSIVSSVCSIGSDINKVRGMQLPTSVCGLQALVLSSPVRSPNRTQRSPGNSHPDPPSSILGSYYHDRRSSSTEGMRIVVLRPSTRFEYEPPHEVRIMAYAEGYSHCPSHIAYLKPTSPRSLRLV